jgi:hypothetical protein
MALRKTPVERRQARKDGTLRRVVPIRIAGAQTAGANKFSFVMPEAGTYVSCYFELLTPNTGATFICDVNKNGTTLYTTQASRPTFVASTTTSAEAAAADVTSLTKGDVLTVDIDAIGSTIAGDDLKVYITYEV